MNKRFLILISIISFVSNISFAASVTTNDGTFCDFSQIVKNADGTFTYSAPLNLCVGKLVQDNATKDAQIADLKKAGLLYQQTIQTDETRIQNLMTTLNAVEARAEAATSLEQKNEFLYFGLGVLATGLAAYTAAKLSNH